MKTSRNNPFSGIQSSASLLPRAAFTLAFTALISCNPARAAALTWDTDASTAGITAGSGDWNTNDPLNTVWNNADINGIWLQTNGTTALSSAIFAGVDADPNTYIVTLGAQMAADGLTFNSNGYQLAGTFGFYLKGASTSTVADGKTVNIACPHLGQNSVFNWIAGTGAVVNISGNISGNQQPRFCGPGSYNLTGVNNPSVPNFLAPVFQTSGSMSPVSSFFVGNLQTINSVVYGTGTYTLGDGSSTDGTATLTFSKDNAAIGRNGGYGTLIIRNGGTANFGLTDTKGNLLVPRDSSTAATPNKGKLDVQGGILNVGVIGGNQAQIQLSGNGSTAAQTADMLQSGGTVSTSGITFGGTGTHAPGSTASLTMTGGTLYIGLLGINEGVGHPTDTITLSGGTVGTLTSWTSGMPMSLATTGGDVTFQCADSGANPFDIALTQSLTGTGGLKKTGTGKLTLSGINDYSGTTFVGDGTLVRVTGTTPSINGPLTLNGSAGAPTVSVTVTNSNQYWQIGKLTCSGGTTTTDIQFGVIPPSQTVAPVEVNGDVDFTVTPLVVVGGTAIANGTYPLIHYTGDLVGTAPTAASLPGYVTGSSITHNPTTKTISLVVTASSFNPALSWRVGDGVWDINTTANWTQSGSAVKFNNGNAVTLDDTASGTTPITITLNTAVSPSAVTANNAGKDYIIAGSGDIQGAGSVNVLGSKALTLSGMNSYSGGTNLSAGTLNIDNGGDATHSAIGTGPLTINAGTLDNTSAGAVTLQPVIPQTWNGNFSYLGSANNLHMGAGPVTLGNNISVSVAANTFTVGGEISGAFGLSKTGAGALALPVANAFSGGLTLTAGRLNVANPGSVGTGTLRLDGGEIDNTSGAEMSLLPSSVVFGSSFSFAGTHSLSLNAPLAPGAGITPVTINVANNTLTLDGEITLANSTIIKNGSGTLSISGNTANGSGALVVNAGRVNLDKASASAIGRSNAGVTVKTTGLLVVTGEGGNQIIDSNTTPFTPVILEGGTFDLNGASERVDDLTISGGGILRNGAAARSSSLTLRTGSSITLSTSGVFDVAEADGVLDIPAPIVGNGALIKSGAGVATLSGANTYSGDTTVNLGTLALSNAPDPLNANPDNDASTVTIAATGATLDLTYTGTDKVDKLFIGTTQLAAGIYGPGATSIPQITNSSGSGTLTVLSSPGAGFSSWITGTFANGTVPTGKQGPNDDPDNDGISNLVEYAVAGQDPTVGNPTIGTFNGTTLSFTKRLDASGLTYAIQDSTDLGITDAWAEVSGGLYVNNASTISFTLTPGTPPRNFLRLQVLSN